MNVVLIGDSCVLVCALIGYLYGTMRYVKKKKVLFLWMVSFAIACQMFARLFQVVFILTQGEFKSGFNIGMLGLAGGFMFLLSANYGGMDSLVDDGSRKHLITRIVSLIAPAIVLGLSVLLLINVYDLSVRIGICVVAVVMVPCIYYNFKHAIIGDEVLGLVKPLRLYNSLAVIYSLAICMEGISVYMNILPLYVAAMSVQAILSLILLPIAGKGVAKWIM